MARGKDKGKVVTAIGRELLSFIWAIGIKVEVAQRRPNGGRHEVSFCTARIFQEAAWVTVERRMERRILESSMR